MFDDQKMTDEQKNDLLKEVGITKFALIDMLSCRMSEEARTIGLKALDKIGFFEGLNGGEELREEMSSNPDSTYKVIYKDKDGQRRETEITASSKIVAALRVSVLGEVIKVVPIRKKK